MIGGVALRVTSPVLVGRVAEAAQLWAAFERAVAGSPATVVVVGEAGVGKTRLVSELLARARARGAGAGRRLPGRGRGVVAYAPMVEALRPLGELLGPEELERVLAGARPELGRLGRRELGELLAGILGEPPAPALVDEILARSEGNPFFAEELLAARV